MLLVPAAAINAAETAAIGQSLRISSYPARVSHAGNCSHSHRMFRQVVQEIPDSCSTACSMAAMPKP